MSSKIKFIALGGGQWHGASCYYIGVDGCNILLDCGSGSKGGVASGPNLNVLLKYLDSLSELDAVLVSHSHFDHIGYLPQFHAMAPNVPIYATEQSKILANHLIWDKGGQYLRRQSRALVEREEIMAENMLESIIGTGYAKTLQFPKFEVTFYEAGHIPGAAMILIETENHRILYTGDFAKQSTPLADGYVIPKSISADTMIICGTHAVNPTYTHNFQGRRLIKMYGGILSEDIVGIDIMQLTKGLEIAKLFNDEMESGRMSAKNIYLDDSIWKLGERLETMGRSVLGRYCRPIPDSSFEKGVYISERHILNGYAKTFGINFTLHASYPETKELIYRVNPKTAFIVHTGYTPEYYDRCYMALEIRRERGADISLIYPENDDVYTV